MTISESQLTALRQAAIDVSRNAWCPYSRFSVGAALLATSGRIFRGCNVENASHGLTICAERVAIGQAIAAGSREFQALLIFTETPKPTAPCGACRQVIAEFAPNLDIICICDGPDSLRLTLQELLPHSFGPHNLDNTSTLSE